jgi:CubicO group peptidase (beta-lactamase class C family)
VSGSDTWRTGSLDTSGLDTNIIDSLKSDVRRGRLSALHSVLVVKDDVLVIEEYFHGARREHCQLIASVTKSLVSVLVGIALDQHPERTVSTPLMAFFQRYRAQASDTDKGVITLEHALTMTAGLDWDEVTHPHPDDRNPNTRMYKVDDPVKFVLGRNVNMPPGKKWAYSSGLSILLGEVVRDISGSDIDEFAEAQVFEPLGIKRHYWHKHAHRTVFSNGDLLLTPRDLAKIGQLVLNEGLWQGRRIVSRRWITESTRRHVATTSRFGYGYHWWRGIVAKGDRRLDVIFGSGTGGQKLFIVPQLKMVVVVTARVFHNDGGHVGAYRVLNDYLIPAALGRRPAIAAHPPTRAFHELATGEYADLESGQTVRVVGDGEKLFLKPTFFTRIELTPIGPRRFTGHWIRTGDIQIDFDVDDKGIVKGLTANFLLRDTNYLKTD